MIIELKSLEVNLERRAIHKEIVWGRIRILLANEQSMKR